MEEEKRNDGLDMVSLDLPFDLNKLMTLQFDTLKHAIEWLAMQQKSTKQRLLDLEERESDRPTSAPFPLLEELKVDGSNGATPLRNKSPDNRPESGQGEQKIDSAMKLSPMGT
jgi:hypothetical protein